MNWRARMAIPTVPMISWRPVSRGVNSISARPSMMADKSLRGGNRSKAAGGALPRITQARESACGRFLPTASHSARPQRAAVSGVSLRPARVFVPRR
jgi:hypothetical protein